MIRLDDLILWVLLCLTVALFASIQYDPCDQYTDGTDAFLECETGQALDLTPVTAAPSHGGS